MKSEVRSEAKIQMLEKKVYIKDTAVLMAHIVEVISKEEDMTPSYVVLEGRNINVTGV